MREVTIAVLILGILIALTITGSCSNCKLYDRMIALAEIAGEDRKDLDARRDAVAALSDLWEENRIRLQATVGHSRTETASQAILRLRAASDHQDMESFHSELAVLLDALEELRQKDCFSLRAII